MRGFTRDTVVELVDRKILWLFGIVTAVMLLIVYASGNIHASFAGANGGEEMDLTAVTTPVAARVLGGVMSFLMFLTVMATTGLFPRMFEKGRADFYLSKSNTRTAVLLGKFAAVWVAYGALMLACGVLVCGLIGVIHHTFSLSFLYLLLIYALLLFVWLSVVALTGIATGSTVMAIMAAFVVWVAQSILQSHDKFGLFLKSKIGAGLIDALYYILPKHGQIGDMAVDLASGQPVASWMPLWSSLLFGLVMLYLTVAVFKRRNY